MNSWSIAMLLSAGLFAGTVIAFAWDRGSAWREMAVGPFLQDFGHTIHRADKIQPTLLVIAIASSAGYAWNTSGVAQILSTAAGAGFLLVLLLSVTIQVPLQRRILRMSEAQTDVIKPMRRRWLSNHVGRTVVSAVSFAIAVVAVSV